MVKGPTFNINTFVIAGPRDDVWSLEQNLIRFSYLHALSTQTTELLCSLSEGFWWTTTLENGLI
jgi:hypothetical protein